VRPRLDHESNYVPDIRKDLTLREENAMLFLVLVRCWEYLSGNPRVDRREVVDRLRETLNWYGRNLSEDERPYAERAEAHRKSEEKRRGLRVPRRTGRVINLYNKIIEDMTSNSNGKGSTAKEIVERISKVGYCWNRKDARTAVHEAIGRYGRGHIETSKRLEKGVWINVYHLNREDEGGSD
jgi:hypothetical protein